MYLYEFENMLGIFEGIKCRFTLIFLAISFGISSSVTMPQSICLLSQYTRSISNFLMTRAFNSSSFILIVLASSTNPSPFSTVNKKSVVITIGSCVFGSVGCLSPNSSAMTIVSSNGNKGNCSRISTTKSEYSVK